MKLLTLRALCYSLLLHGVVIAALVVTLDDAARTPVFKPRPQENIVEAVTVDDQAVEQELQRLQELEQEKQRAMEQKLKDLEELARVEETRQREAEQKKQAAERQRREAEQRQAEAEQKRKEAERKQAAERKRIEAEKRQAEAELKRIEEKKRAAEAERKRIEEEQRKAEAERQRLAEEQRRKAAEAAELERQVEAQRAQDQKTLQNIVEQIYLVVSRNFNKTGLPKGLEGVLSVQTIPGGEVISVTINESSGNEVFDRRAVTAVQTASPLPLPADPALFDRLRLRKFNFKFAPRD
ncbi:MAG: cell envelope integrity protein TolA [Gammaproteobacteria bacterium]|nr:cell envelope integrity protein TolA [Gammaproteobacteria bacterium]